MKFESFGFVGIETAISPENKFIQYTITDAFVKSMVDPFDFIALNFRGIGMMFSGELDVRQNLSGPIRIAKIAGDTAYYRGVSAFVVLMAKISIILMVMNLLPIPMVDGSYILIFLYEAVTRRAFNQKLLEKIQMIGFAILVLLSIFVIFNDLSFLPFFKDLF
jgi:regulator of sigma E protease